MTGALEASIYWLLRAEIRQERANEGVDVVEMLGRIAGQASERWVTVAESLENSD